VEEGAADGKEAEAAKGAAADGDSTVIDLVEIEDSQDGPPLPPAGGASTFTCPRPKWAPKPAKPPASTGALKEYYVDNRKLSFRTPGLGFRRSKDLNDKDPSNLANWGSLVRGVNEGDGWLKVMKSGAVRYLPFQTDGITVLTAVSPSARLGPAAPFLKAQKAAAAKQAILKGSVARGPWPVKQALAAAIGAPQQPGVAWQAPGKSWLQQGGGAAALKGVVVAPRPPGVQQPWLVKRPIPADPGLQAAAKKNKAVTEPQAACDNEGRQYELRQVVVNFANVGATYGKKVLGKSAERGERIFDWEGVRRCVRHLRFELGMQVIGVIFENFWGSDNGSKEVVMPADIRQVCASIEETPRLTGRNQKSADDEMTIKCAWRRNCRFMDNDNYRDWLKEMRNDKCRAWLEKTQELLQMRYYFDSTLGSFDTLDGNIPQGLLASGSIPPKR